MSEPLCSLHGTLKTKRLLRVYGPSALFGIYYTMSYGLLSGKPKEYGSYLQTFERP